MQDNGQRNEHIRAINEKYFLQIKIGIKILIKGIYERRKAESESGREGGGGGNVDTNQNKIFVKNL